MKTKTSRQTATERADIAMGQFIRLRDCLWTGKNHVWGYCISCGGRCTYEYSETRDPRTVGQAGHFIPRGYFRYRWDMLNVNLQCRYCNEFLHGNMEAYREGMIAKYSLEVVEAMERGKILVQKYTVEEILELCSFFREAKAEIRKRFKV